MTSDTQTDLFTKPREIECAGHDLADVLAAVESRGGMVQRMDCVGLSHYRLAVVWPLEASPASRVSDGHGDSRFSLRYHSGQAGRQGGQKKREGNLFNDKVRNRARVLPALALMPPVLDNAHN